MNASQVHCFNCGVLVPAVDINIKAMTGKCVACDHIFDIASPSTHNDFDRGVTKRTRDFDNSPPPRPKNISIESGPANELSAGTKDVNPFFNNYGELLHLKIRWFTPMLFGIIFFCIAWDSFLVFWYSIALTQPNTPWIMIVFPICHVAVGVGLTYSTIASLFNSTHIIADQHVLSIKHGPVPWWANKELNVKDIRKLMIRKSHNTYQNHNSQISFKVVADVNGEETPLLNRLEQSHARYIAYQLAKQTKVDLKQT